MPLRAEWMGTPAASRHLGISPRTLYRLIDTGRIPAYEIGRVYRVRTADLDAFLVSARVPPGALRHLYAAEDSPGDDQGDEPSLDSAEGC